MTIFLVQRLCFVALKKAIWWDSSSADVDEDLDAKVVRGLRSSESGGNNDMWQGHKN